MGVNFCAFCTKSVKLEIICDTSKVNSSEVQYLQETVSSAGSNSEGTGEPLFYTWMNVVHRCARG